MQCFGSILLSWKIAIFSLICSARNAHSPATISASLDAARINIQFRCIHPPSRSPQPAGSFTRFFSMCPLRRGGQRGREKGEQGPGRNSDSRISSSQVYTLRQCGFSPLKVAKQRRSLTVSNSERNPPAIPLAILSYKLSPSPISSISPPPRFAVSSIFPFTSPCFSCRQFSPN